MHTLDRDKVMNIFARPENISIELSQLHILKEYMESDAFKELPDFVKEAVVFQYECIDMSVRLGTKLMNIDNKVN